MKPVRRQFRERSFLDLFLSQPHFGRRLTGYENTPDLESPSKLTIPDRYTARGHSTPPNRTFTAYQHDPTLQLPNTADMSNSVQDPSATESKAFDTPVDAPEKLEKGKGKASDDAMEDDDDDDESGEVSCDNKRC